MRYSYEYEENIQDSLLISFRPRTCSRFITDIVKTKKMFKIHHWYCSDQENVQDSSLVSFRPRKCSRFITGIVQTKNMFKIHHWYRSDQEMNGVNNRA
jgi:hypothetical protein